MSNNNEAVIFVNGRQLSLAESITVRVALNSFAHDLRVDGLGDDERGHKMVESYTKNINSILDSMHNGIPQ